MGLRACVVSRIMKGPVFVHLILVLCAELSECQGS